MLGPVISSSLRSSSSSQSLAMKRSIWFSTTGWRPCSIASIGSATSCGAHQLWRSAWSASATSVSSWASACAMRLQRADVRRQVVQQLFVQLFLARQRPVLRRQRLVLEGLQFRRDVALGILQRLAAAVVVRHLVGLAVGDFDVKAMHLVVLDAQVGDAGAGAFARLQVDQELAGVLRQRRAVRRARRRSRARSRRRRAPWLPAPARSRARAGPGMSPGVASASWIDCQQRRIGIAAAHARHRRAGPAVAAARRAGRPGRAAAPTAGRCGW